MKILTLLAIFHLCCTSIVKADLDDTNPINNVLAIYHFDHIDEDENGTYVVSHTPHEIRGYLRNDASISNEGKYQKALSITEKGFFRAKVERPISLWNNHISIAACVKVPPQKVPLRISLNGTSRVNATGSRSLEVLPTGELRVFGIFAVAPPQLGAVSMEYETIGTNLTDNKWHHIAYSHHEGMHRLFVDGEIVFDEQDRDIGIFGDVIYISVNQNFKPPFEGELLIDDVGFFEIGLSPHQIQDIYNDGLENFLKDLPVNPQSKLATTWSKIKYR